MYILKICRPFPTSNDDNSEPNELKYSEEVNYFTLTGNPTIFRTDVDSYSSDLLDVVFTVKSDDAKYYIYREESAYLLNQDGKTLQVIHRP